ncbi:unnamed protein product, partial [Cyprideis torosa]
MKWQDAENHCVAYGNNTHLASLESSGERDFLIGIKNNTRVWLGGSDLELEAKWVNTDGTPFWMGAWEMASDQPDNYNDNRFVINKKTYTLSRRKSAKQIPTQHLL